MVSLDRESYSSVTCLEMALQVRLDGEAVATQVTDERPLVRVGSQMHLQLYKGKR